MTAKHQKYKPSGKNENKSPLRSSPKQKTLDKSLFEDPRFLGSVLIILTCIAFFPSLRNDFMSTWDDNAYVTTNTIIRNLNLHSLRMMFTKQVNGTYVPLPLLTYTIEFSLFGLKAFPYHLTNLILHLICTLLVFRLFRLLKINIFFAAAAAVLFGVHPMRVESVAWIAERKDVLYSLFYLAALVSHVRFIQVDDQSKKQYRLTLLFFFLALLSKIEAVTLPLSMLLIDYYLERPLKFSLIREKIPHFLLSLLFGCLGIFILSRTGLLSVNHEIGFADRLFYGLFTLTCYIFKFLIPYQQSAIYPYPVASGHSLPWLLYVNPVVIAGMGFLLYKTLKFTRSLIFGALFFLVNVIFLLQILAAGNAYLADRYTYIAYIGLIFMMTWGLEQFVKNKKGRQTIVSFGLFVVITIFMVMTFNRCEVWKNGITLWTDVIEQFPGKSVAPYSNRGIAYTKTGDWENAFTDFTKAISINPKYPESYSNRGEVYANLGQTDNAIVDFTSALKLDPTLKTVLHNRGVAYGALGQYDKAVTDLNHAIKIDPKYISAYNNLSIIYCLKNQVDSAIKICIDGLKVNPDIPVLQAGLGNCYLEKADISNAELHYKNCLKTDERNLDALLGMAVVSYMKNELGYAKGYLEQAQMVEPALSNGMEGIDQLEKAGYLFSKGKKEVLARLYAQMK